MSEFSNYYLANIYALYYSWTELRDNCTSFDPLSLLLTTERVFLTGRKKSLY